MMDSNPEDSRGSEDLVTEAPKTGMVAAVTRAEYKGGVEAFSSNLTRQ